MARETSDCPSPKRGAYPTPRNVLADAMPYKPDSSDQHNKPNDPGLASDHPDAEPDFDAASREQPYSGNGPEKGS
jgi:hypothetical protein